ncbi:MAG TPA: SPFH domain-containing protein [Candidatus Nitrosocosmicus sp.]|nr:SPFH domain-containing protein [Candidatus Nitrosocosmicus sp.]
MMKKIIIWGIAIVALLGLLTVPYTVAEDEVALVKRWGMVQKVIVNAQDVPKVRASLKEKGYDVAVTDKKGLNFRIPFADDITKYTTKYLTYISMKETVNTADRKKIDIMMYSQYRIVNPVLVNMRNYSKGDLNKLMDDRVYPVVIQTANTLRFDEFFDKGKTETVLKTRTEALSKELLNDYGVEVADIAMHRRNFPAANIQSIQNKMIEEIRKDSEKLKAEGQSQYDKDVSEAERQKKEIIAKAIEDAANIKANADKEAIKIYEESLRKDIEFYRFIQRTDTYKSMKDTTVFIDKDNDFMDYINGYKR